MPLVQAKCTQCGASLKVNNEASTALCPFCKMEYVVQDAINNYVTNNYTHIDTLNAEHVTVNDDRSAEQRLRAAEQNMQFKEYDKALSIFREVTEIAPHDYRSWWGCVRAETRGFAPPRGSVSDLQRFLAQVSTDATRAITTAPLDKQSELKQSYNHYCGILNKDLEDRKNKMRLRINELKMQKQQASSDKKDAETASQNAEADAQKKSAIRASCSYAMPMNGFRQFLAFLGVFYVGLYLIVLAVDANVLGILIVGLVHWGIFLFITLNHKISLNKYKKDTKRLDQEVAHLRQRAGHERQRADQLAKTIGSLTSQLSQLDSELSTLQTINIQRFT